ncbi:PREDICTED: protein PBMUCL2-like [Propithecus coquereli]|uniref:protein PBMUCL2-like n=1 Tax=Propithecus coquereli TaxID=379532 RepID=UPI00063ED4CE|nr:PREDICTED: protein PBMUCL2-like [Propithecus coquereli]
MEVDLRLDMKEHVALDVAWAVSRAKAMEMVMESIMAGVLDTQEATAIAMKRITEEAVEEAMEWITGEATEEATAGHDGCGCRLDSRKYRISQNVSTNGPETSPKDSRTRENDATVDQGATEDDVTTDPGASEDITTDPGTTEDYVTTDPGASEDYVITDPGTTEDDVTTDLGTTEDYVTKHPGTTEDYVTTDPGTTEDAPAPRQARPVPSLVTGLTTPPVEKEGQGLGHCDSDYVTTDPGTTEDDVTTDLGTTEDYVTKHPGNTEDYVTIHPGTTADDATKPDDTHPQGTALVTAVKPTCLLTTTGIILISLAATAVSAAVFVGLGFVVEGCAQALPTPRPKDLVHRVQPAAHSANGTEHLCGLASEQTVGFISVAVGNEERKVQT